MKELYRLFSGVKRKSANTYAYAVAVLHDELIDQLEPAVTDANSFHRASLVALISGMEYVVRDLKGTESAVHYHTKCNDIAFEWMVEYAEDGEFSPQTRDYDLWMTVLGYVRKYGIELEIYGKDSALTGLTGAMKVL